MRFCLSSAHLRRSVWNSLGGRACRVSMGWCALGRECSEHVKKIPPQAAFAVSPSFFICLHLSFFLSFFTFTGFTSWTSSWVSQWLTLSLKSDVVELINMRLQTVSNPLDRWQSGCQDSGEPSAIQIGFCYVNQGLLGVNRFVPSKRGFGPKSGSLVRWWFLDCLFHTFIHVSGAIFFWFHDCGTLMVPCSHLFMDSYKFFWMHSSWPYKMYQNVSCSLSLHIPSMCFIDYQCKGGTKAVARPWLSHLLCWRSLCGSCETTWTWWQEHWEWCVQPHTLFRL